MWTDQKDVRAVFRYSALLAISLWLAGCASTGGPAPDASAQRDAETPVRTVTRPAKPPKFETDEELGFTITESVRITSDVREAYGNALRLLQRGDLEAGVQALESVIADAPELTAPYIDLGIAQAGLGRLDEAEASLEHALLLTPDHPVAHNELGIVYRRTGRFELARASYERALGILGDFHYAQRNLGVLCDLFLEDLACALANYQAYQLAFPDDQEVNMWIADIQNRLPAQPPEVAQ